MNSYGSVDGLPCAGSPSILTGLLRDELGFDGVVVADYFAVGLLREHHKVAGSNAEAASLALAAGLDAELPALDCFAELPAEVAAGRVPMELIDRAVRRVLSLKFALGLFERPYVDAGAAAAVFDTPAQRALARRAAAEAVVLLANDGVLPLADDLGSIAVIGPGADDRRLLQGDYHYPAHIELQLGAATTPPESEPGTGSGEPVGTPFLPPAGGELGLGMHYTDHVTPLQAMRAAFGEERVVHARGCDVTGDDRSGLDAAAAAAAAAAVAVVVVGGRSGLDRASTVGEGLDAMDLGLTGVQPELVDRVVATGTPTVVVVLSGRVHTLAGLPEAGALLYAAPLGVEGGHGLVDVLTGALPPSGRLPVTLPRSVGQVPVFAGHRAGGGKAMFHGTYSDGPTDPLFCFGHGRSYTTFAYSDLLVSATDTGAVLEVACRLENTGHHEGVEVVQVYVSDLVASVARPERQLVGFARVSLAPGGAATVRFTVHPSRLAFYDQDMQFVCEPGEYQVSVGGSSADLPLAATVGLGGGKSPYLQREVVATASVVEPA